MVGDAAQNQTAMKLKKTAFTKFQNGRHLSDQTVQDMKHWSSDVILGDGNDLKVHFETKGETKMFPPETSSWF